MLNTRLQAPELVTILNHSGARLLLGEPHLLACLEPAAHELKALKRIVTDYESFLETGDSSFQAVVPEENGVISINYTSGTTGLPKGVMYTHRGAYMNALGEALEHGLSHSSIYLWTVPMFHCNGWCFTWAVTAVGARHICLGDFDPQRAVELIQREGITHLCGSPTVLLMITEYCRKQGIRFGRRLKIVTAGAPPSPAVIRAVEEMEAEVAHVYGLTETYGPHTVCAWQQEWDTLPLAERATLRARQGVGYVVAGTDLRVVDADMNDVPPDGNTLGEVVMRGNNVMAGIFSGSRGHGRGLYRRLVSLRRLGRHASQRLHRSARPQQRHHHFRRREYLFGRSGENPLRSPRGIGGCRSWSCRSQVGRSSARLRNLARRDRRHRERTHRLLPEPPGPLQVSQIR